MKKTSGKGRVDLEKRQIEQPPDVREMYKEAYRGKTKTTHHPNSNTPIITDTQQDPYKGHRSTKKHANSSGEGNPLNIEVNFDKKSYQERIEKEE